MYVTVSSKTNSDADDSGGGGVVVGPREFLFPLGKTGGRKPSETENSVMLFSSPFAHKI